jgi:hypothetical protein
MIERPWCPSTDCHVQISQAHPPRNMPYVVCLRQRSFVFIIDVVQQRHLVCMNTFLDTEFGLVSKETVR